MTQWKRPAFQAAKAQSRVLCVCTTLTPKLQVARSLAPRPVIWASHQPAQIGVRGTYPPLPAHPWSRLWKRDPAGPSKRNPWDPQGLSPSLPAISSDLVRVKQLQDHNHAWPTGRSLQCICLGWGATVLEYSTDPLFVTIMTVGDGMDNHEDDETEAPDSRRQRIKSGLCLQHLTPVCHDQTKKTDHVSIDTTISRTAIRTVG